MSISSDLNLAIGMTFPPHKCIIMAALVVRVTNVIMTGVGWGGVGGGVRRDSHEFGYAL